MAIAVSDDTSPRQRHPQSATSRHSNRGGLPRNLFFFAGACAVLMTPRMAWATDYTSTFSCTNSALCSLLPTDTVNTITGLGVSSSAVAQVTINGTPVTTSGADGHGLFSTGIGTVINATGATVKTSGADSIGAFSSSGGQINLSGSTITTTGDDSYGLWAQAGLNSVGSSLSITDTAIHTSGANSYGALIQSYGTIAFNGGNSIATTGASAHAIRAQTVGNQTFDGTAGRILPAITVSGDGAAVLDVAIVSSSITMAGTTALNMGMTLGANTWGAKVEGSGGSNIAFSGSSSTGGTGLWVVNSAGSLLLNGNADAAGSRVRLDAGTFNLSGHAGGAGIGSLEGASTANVNLGANTLTIGANNAGGNASLVDNANYAGHFSGTGGLVKTGGLTQILSGAGTVVSAVEVNGGTLRFEQNGAFNTQGGYTTLAGATTAIGQLNSTLNILGTFTQAAGANLDATLGASPDIVAANATLGGNLVISGFVGGPTPAKASEIVANEYTFIHTTGGITGDFANNPLGNTGPDYLLHDGHVSPNGMDYELGFRLAWTDGAQPSGTGTFTLGAGTGFDVDIALADQPVPAGGFASGWNGHDLVKAGDGMLILSAANTYTGSTTIDGGILRTGIADAFAQSSDVVVNSGATLDLDGYNQFANRLAGAGTIALGSAMLNANNDSAGDSSAFNGSIAGSGGLIKTGSGTLALGGASSYAGGTALKQGRIDIGSNTALGTGELAMDDSTTLGFVTDGLVLANNIRLTGSNDPIIDTGSFSETLGGAITGAGFLVKQGSGELTLTGDNTYTGDTVVETGTLRAGAFATFSAASAHSVASGATIDLAGFDQTIAALANSGTVSLTGTVPGTTLTVTGPYTGNDGVLRLGTALGDSGSISDRLILSGTDAVASGSTSIQITNIGGLGALTTGDGIELVGARNGATTTAQTTRDAFLLAGGQIDAGAYEYRLYAADANGAGESWYLRSTIAVAPGPESEPDYRPEVSLFAGLPAQQRQADLAMLDNLHRRIGDEDTSDPDSTATDDRMRRAWGRAIGSDIDIRQQGTVNPTSRQRLWGLQAGTDLWVDSGWRTGAYLGHLEGDASVDGFAQGIADLHVGKNDLRSQYLGVYGTYAGDTGFYADLVAQAARHRYTLRPILNGSEEGKGDSLLVSIEVGQAFALSERWQLESQLQAMHQTLDLDDVDIVGARVRQNIDDSWLGRIGLRLKGTFATGMGVVQPYARLNLYLAPDQRDVARFIGPAATTDIVTRAGHTSTELAAGATWQLAAHASLYGELGVLSSSSGPEKIENGLQGSLGARFRW